jgi:3-oxoacyl-[acyl-carrier-protein] synthase II
MGLMRWTLLNRLNTQSNEAPENACRPYDREAAGSVLAEGGAVLVIEEYEHAKRRGATIYAEVVGLGASSNASVSVIEPDTSGEAPGVALKKALKDAGISAEQVGMVVPTGYGIVEWDRADVAALKYAFGGALAGMAVTAMRAGIGDCGAGAQAIDLVGAVMALHSQVVPPTANTKHVIEGLPLAMSKVAKGMEFVAVLTSALGGQNSAVILKRVS